MKRILSILILLAIVSIGALKAQQQVGTTTLSVGPVSTNSLLPGCAVSASNTVINCAKVFPPSGWSLALADGFEGSGSGCALAQPANESMPINTLNMVVAHTGLCSMDIIFPQGSGNNYSPGDFLYISGPGIGCCTNGDFYLSEWRYFDNNAVNGGQAFEGVFGNFAGGGTTPIDSSTNQWITFDLQNYNPVSAPNAVYDLYSQTNIPSSFGPCDDGPTAKNCGFSQYTGPIYQFPLGRWEQDELYYHASTCTTGVPNNDGFANLYVNGALVFQVNAANSTNFGLPAGTGGNANGCVNMTINPEIMAGGYFTFFGPNPTFHVHQDDVIVLKR